MAMQEFVAATAYRPRAGNAGQVFAGLIPNRNPLIAIDGKHGIKRAMQEVWKGLHLRYTITKECLRTKRKNRPSPEES